MQSLERHLFDHMPDAQKTIADDLESFVYVLAYMALRYQRHDHSPEKVLPEGYSLAELAAANDENNSLAYLLENLFEGGWDTVRQQRHFIKQGRPPVRLLPGADGLPTPLAVLLRKLYLNLQEHALALYQVKELEKEEEMRRTEAARLAEERRVREEMRTTRNMAQTSQPPEQPPRRYRYDVFLPSDREPTLAERLNSIQTSVLVEMPRLARDVAMRARTRKCKQVMDSHDAMIEAFSSVIFDDDGNAKLKRLDVSDKYVDQWLGLRGVCGSRFQPPTTEEKRRSEKRGAVDAPGEPEKRLAKRRKIW